MPKHIIEDRFNGQSVHKVSDDGTRGEEVVMVSPFLHVGWTRDAGHFEIATRAGGDYDGDHARPGFYVHLDREAANDLIRTLRRARDAAFGSDA